MFFDCAGDNVIVLQDTLANFNFWLSTTLSDKTFFMLFTTNWRCSGVTVNIKFIFSYQNRAL